MQKMSKRIGAWVMLFVMMLSLVGVMPMKVQAEGTVNYTPKRTVIHGYAGTVGSGLYMGDVSFLGEESSVSYSVTGIILKDTDEETDLIQGSIVSDAGSSGGKLQISTGSQSGSTTEYAAPGVYTVKMQATLEGEEPVEFETEITVCSAWFTPVSDDVEFESGKEETKKIGTLTKRDMPSDARFTIEVGAPKDAYSGSVKVDESIATAIIKDNGDVEVTMKAAAEAKTYYIGIRAEYNITTEEEEERFDSFSVTSGWRIYVKSSEDTTIINTVNIDIPKNVIVGSSIPKFIENYGNVDSDAKYTIMREGFYAPGIWPYLSDGKTMLWNKETLVIDSGEGDVFKSSRIYRSSIYLEAKDGYKFADNPVINANNVKIYHKSVESEKTRLYISFEYSTVGSSGTGGTINGSIGGSSSGGSTSSSGTITVPAATVPSATAPSSSATIPVTGNSDSSVSVSVSGNTATIGDISQTTINTTTSGNTDTNVTLDLSGRGNVDTATIPTSSIDRIADSTNNTNTNSTGLEVKFAGGSVVLDGQALAAITQAAGSNVSISVKTVTTTNLNSRQQNAVLGQNVVQVVTVTISSGSKAISSLGSGSQTVSMNYNLAAGQNGRNLHAFYVSPAGTMTRQKTSFSNGRVSFRTNHNSDYVIVYDESLSNEDFENIFRVYNPGNGDHLLTINKTEYDKLVKIGWKAEGMVFDVLKKGGDNVYRVYNPNTGEHFYTANSAEKDNLVKAGWKYEGAVFVSSGSKKVYRVYNPNQNSNNHLFTTNEAEYNKLEKEGWKKEGEVFSVI